MKQLKVVLALLCLTSFVRGQDSTSVLSHEIGFNTVRILSQIAQINTNNVNQLPYDVFYNLYYKDKVGLRLGAGILTSYTEDGINKQEFPVTTTSNHVNLRIGVSYNYASYKWVTLNGFVDYIYAGSKMESASSTTTQVFPDPIVTAYNKTSTTIRGAGFQIGTGVKFNINKRIALYAELPFVFIREKIKVDNIYKETGVEKDVTTRTDSRRFGSTFILPATIYFVLRF